MSNYFTYYIEDSEWIKYRAKYNTEKFEEAKMSLFNEAGEKAAQILSTLDQVETIKNATQFISIVAENERAKELAAVKKFCNKYKNEFPTLETMLNNPNTILEKPMQFYQELITAINKMRKGSEEYLLQLKNIRQRIAEAEQEEKRLSDYKISDYRYRTDIESFVHRLVGNYNLLSDNGEATEESKLNTASAKMGTLVMNILNKLDIPAKIASGQDFTAIAVATYLDVQKQLQKIYDTHDKFQLIDKEKRMSQIIDQVGDTFEKEYVDQLLKQDQKLSPVQKALANIYDTSYFRLVKTVKEILGIKMLTEEDAERQIKKIQSNMRDNKKSTAAIRSMVSNMKKNIYKNRRLNDSLKRVKMTISGSANSKHGTIYEVIEAIAADNSSKVRGNAGVDLFTAEWEITYDDTEAQRLMENLMDEMGNELTAVAKKITDSSERDASKKDITQDLNKMNDSINKLIAAVEQKIQKMNEFNGEQFFIYHETLKLSSAAETGRNEMGGGFHGRTLGILNYIDFMLSASNSFDFPINRDDFAFLSLNLDSQAAAPEARDPLAEYFSLFAGMLMFDDVQNMAQAAIEQTKASSTVVQVHLYNLNGIYVPASFLLSYISDEVKAAEALVESNYAATASISGPAASATYTAYKTNVGNKISANSEEYYLRSGVWYGAANENAQSTKVKIAFLQSFTNLIKNLSGK